MSKRSRQKTANMPQLRPGKAASPSPARSVSYRTLAACFVIVLATTVAYAPILQKEALPSPKAGFLLDDDALVIENAVITQIGLQGLYDIWFSTKAVDYWPIANTAFWIEWRLFGMNPIGYHAVSLVLHCVEALLLWLILKRLKIPGAYFAALLFALHPVNVESVAWIASQKNLWAMLFVQLAVLCYLKIEIPCESGGENRFTLWYSLSLICFVAAAFGKGSAVVLPAILLLIVYWIRPLRLTDVYRIVPFFAIAAVLAVVNVWFQTHGQNVDIRPGATWSERMILAGCAIWFYVAKTFVPLGLTPFYPRWAIDAGNPLWYVPTFAALGVSAGLVYFQFKKRAWAKPLFFAWFFALIAFIPVLGFVDVGFFRFAVVADRYQHLAIIGLLALTTGLIAGGTEGAIAKGHPLRIGALCFLATLCLPLTASQSSLYANAVRWYEAAIAANPNCGQAHNNLANEFYRTPGKLDAAEKEYLIALRLKPNLPEAENNLGSIEYDRGHYEEAIKRHQNALQLQPDYSQAHNNWGNALFRLGRFEEAVPHYEEALRLNPDYPEALNNMAVSFHRRDRMKEAIPYYERAVILNPDYYDARCNLAKAYLAELRFADALAEGERALAVAQKAGRADWENSAREWLQKTAAAKETILRNQAPQPNSQTEKR